MWIQGTCAAGDGLSGLCKQTRQILLTVLGLKHVIAPTNFDFISTLYIWGYRFHAFLFMSLSVPSVLFLFCFPFLHFSCPVPGHGRGPGHAPVPGQAPVPALSRANTQQAPMSVYWHCPMTCIACPLPRSWALDLNVRLTSSTNAERLDAGHIGGSGGEKNGAIRKILQYRSCGFGSYVIYHPWSLYRVHNFRGNPWEINGNGTVCWKLLGFHGASGGWATWIRMDSCREEPTHRWKLRKFWVGNKAPKTGRWLIRETNVGSFFGRFIRWYELDLVFSWNWKKMQCNSSKGFSGWDSWS